MFETYYRTRMAEIIGEPLRPDDGTGEPEVRVALAARGLAIPRALAEYYAVAGRHWINASYDRLTPIDELEWADDRLVFLEENQLVAFWAVVRDGVSEPDPVVWEGLNGAAVEWHPTGYRVSQFLMARWRFVMTGEQESPA